MGRTLVRISIAGFVVVSKLLAWMGPLIFVLLVSLSYHAVFGNSGRTPP